MLRKNSKIAFGGMWVFPGGKIDPADRDGAADDDAAARVAAARETEEETGLVVQPDAFEWFARWTPPPGPNKRFTTWFFAAQVSGDEEVVIDGGEIHDYQWINIAEAVRLHDAGELGLYPPTIMTLRSLQGYMSAEDALIGYVLTGGFGPQVLMARFDFLTDGEMAAVLTYVRDAFGSGSAAITTDQVRRVRAQIDASE